MTDTKRIQDIENEATRRFAEACYDDNSVGELRQALADGPDEQDMRTWSLSPEQWRQAIAVALKDRESEEAPGFYEYIEEGCHTESLRATSFDAALDEARDLLRQGDWGQEDSRKTIHVEAAVRLVNEDGEEIGDERYPVSARIDPAPPEPEGIEHDWCSPHELLGGLEENPGVFGKGGGAVVTEVCANTGWYRVTDGWDQSQGPEPVETIEYEEPDHESLNWAAFADPQRVTVLLEEDTPGVESFAAEIQEEYGYQTHIGLGSPSGRLEIEIEGVTHDVAQSPAVRDMESRIEERLEAWIAEREAPEPEKGARKSARRRDRSGPGM